MNRKRILPPTYLFVAIVAMVALHFFMPVMKVVAFPWGLLGAIPLAIGIAVNIIASNTFDKAGTTVKPFEESTALITDGVFRISRHPMYLGFVLLLLGLALMLGSLTPFAVPAVFAVLMELVFIRTEERMLEATFGARWLDYKKQVRRWV